MAICAAPQQAFLKTNAWDTEYPGVDGYTYRHVIPNSFLDLSASLIKIHFGYLSSDWEISEGWVGHKGDTYAFDGGQVQIKWDGGSTSKIITAAVESDWLTFNLDSAKDLVLALYINSGYDKIVSSNIDESMGTYWKLGNDAATEAASGYTTSGASGDHFFIDAICIPVTGAGGSQQEVGQEYFQSIGNN